MFTKMTSSMLRIAIVLLMASVAVRAQYQDTLGSKRLNSFEGYHFLVGYMQNENYIQQSGIRLRLIIATALPAHVVVLYPGGSPTPYTIAANTSLTITVPSNFEVRQNERRLRSLVDVSSDVPVSVYAMNSQSTTSDSYAVIPISNWNTQYTVLSAANDGYGAGQDSLGIAPSEIRQSEFLIMAAYDNTYVEFKPTAQTESGRASGVWWRDTLQKGECFLVKSAPIRVLTGDLTGTSVRANLPIAVLSGHSRTSMPQGLSASQDSKDHLAEWLMPDQTLSTEYISTPFWTDARIPVGDIIRIVATQPNTHISLATERADLQYTLKNAGDVQTVNAMTSPGWFTSDKPISIGQYMLTGAVGGTSSFDPSLAVVPPTDKFIARSVFQTPFNLADPSFAAQFQNHYVNVVCDSIARYSLKLDGVNVSKSIAPEILTQKFRSSPYFWAQIKLQPGKHEMSCDTGGFSGTLYGMGYTDSYAHTLGFATMVGYKDTLAPEINANVNCGILTGTVDEVQEPNSTSIAYVIAEPDSTVNYSFTTSDLQSNPDHLTFQAKPIDPYKDAKIWITARDKAGNGHRYRYYYRAPRFTQSSFLQFFAKSEKDSLCQRLFIQCPTSFDSLMLYSVRFVNKSTSLVLNAPSSFPIKIAPHGALDFSLCFIPRGQSGLKVQDTIIFDIGCNMVIKVAVKASTPTSSIVVSDVEFGDVVVGDTVCKTMTVVNNGTRSADINSTLLSFPTPEFIFNTTSFLPKTLKPGDSLSFVVCFAPRDTFDLHRFMVFDNSLGLDVRGDIHGHGVRSILSIADIDFKKLRIATYKDTNLVIRNRGNVAANVVYTGQSGDNAEFLHSMGNGKTFNVAAHDSLLVPMRFYPLQPGPYSTKLSFKSTVKNALSIEQNSRGEGTVPVDREKDVWFDTINVNSSKSLRQACLFALGNETLTVDTIKVGGADAASFVFNNAQLGFRQIQVSDSASFDISFKPKRVGKHTATLTITHDADKAYLRKQSVINVVGWARDTTHQDTTHRDTTQHDTIAPRLKVIVDPAPYACDQLPFRIIVQNLDTIALTADQYSETNTVSIDSILTPKLPRLIGAKRSDTLAGVLRPLLRKGSMTVHVRCAGRSLDTVIQISPHKAQLSADLQQAIVTKPKDTVQVTFAGRFSSYSTVPETMVLHSSIPDRLLYALSNSSKLVFSPNRPSVSLTISQRVNEIIATTNAPLSIDTSLSWSFTVPMMALFADESLESVSTSVEPMNCYDNTVQKNLVSVQAVCANDVRNFQLTGFAVKQVFPQPAGEQIRIDIHEFSSSEFINVVLVDCLGRIFPLAENLLLRKDDNSLIFDLHSIPSGFYRVELQSQDDRKQIPIMLTK